MQNTQKQSKELSNKYTNDDLKRMQAWDLDTKIAVSLTRITEFYNKFPHKIYISFSGGKDSTVLLHLVRSIYPDTPAAFVDTGLEYPELRAFVKTVPNVVWLKPEMNFKKVIETYGYPLISKNVSHNVSVARRNPNGKVKKNCFDPNKKGQYAMYKWSFLLEPDAPIISEKCCDVMKKKPAYKFSKETGMQPIVGTMASESMLRRDIWLKTGCNAFDTQHPKSMPLSFWTENDILAYIKKYIQSPLDTLWHNAQYEHGTVRKKARKELRKQKYQRIGYAPVYGDIKQDSKGNYYTTGCHRIGCVYCGFGCHLEKEPNRFQKLKETHPKIWEYCMREWDKGGLGMRKVLDYIGVKVE